MPRDRHSGSPGAKTPHASALDGARSRREWLRRLSLFGAGASALPWLVACQPVPPAPLRLGVNAWVGYDPLVLAREQGLLDTQAVKVVELASMADSLRHFRNRLLDAVATTLDETLRLAASGLEPRIVAVLSESTGSDVVMARAELRELWRLRGRTVAVEATSVGALMLRRLIQAAKLQLQDVKVMWVDASQHGALLRSGRVDAAVMYEPLAGPLRADGMVPIFDSRQMPGDVVDVLVVHDDVLQERPAQVRAMLEGWQRGLQRLQQQPEPSYQLLTLGTGLSPEAYAETVRGVRFYSPAQSLDLLSGRPLKLGQNAQRLVKTLMDMGLLADTPDWSRLVVADVIRTTLTGAGGGQ